MIHRNNILFIICFAISLNFSFGQADFSSVGHPGLTLTQKGVISIQEQLGKLPLLDSTLAAVKKEVDEDMGTGIHVPIPRDMAGGYTHERHKKNFFMLRKAGILYQILEDETYAQYIKDVLFKYAKIYKDLPLHPTDRSYARGKIFWQCLNDANWLVYVSQAYDCIYNWLPKEDRDYLEGQLFRPFADFLSLENPKFFNRIHNHSTWGNAAVGMIGLVMRDTSLVNRALYGMNKENLELNAEDNDGGLIYDPDGKAGFMANLDEAFSPSGYYTEGPYYQRYAMYPFMVFAESLYNTGRDKAIFRFKDSVLIKAVSALVELTDSDGEFFPLNDAQKGMSYYSRSLIAAVDIAYYYGKRDPFLLEIAKKQQIITLDDAGLSVALGVNEKEAKVSPGNSIELLDGPKGQQGGIAVLRSEKTSQPMSVVMKYTSQGNSHGHYDKLSFSMYDSGNEVIQDYGLARFVNIDQKNGGGYLKENTTWAKQTIAHNTIVRDQASHFDGDFKTGSQYHSSKYFSDFSKRNIQIISAKESNAYPGTDLHRTLALIDLDIFEEPIVVDVFRVSSDEKHQLDLPYYFMGQPISMDFTVLSGSDLKPLGQKNGYQHLYREAAGKSEKETAKFCWLANGKFYTLTTATGKEDTLMFTRIGASDPEFNLRRDPGFMIRRNEASKTVFISVIEQHGSYSPVSEIAKNAFSAIKGINVLWNTEKYTAVEIETLQKERFVLAIANDNPSEKAQHEIKHNGTELQWQGPYKLFINQ